MRNIVNLNKDSRWELKAIGTKAFNLQKLMVIDTRIPSCSVVTIDAFRKCPNKQISESLLEELTQNFPKWTCPIIARSSSLAEDTSRSSKAGVFTTIPNVNNLSDMKKAIEKVWLSSQGEDIAVILQEQLKPDIAGVLFTRDPITGKNKKVIEYVEGMGDTLVSGLKNPVRVDEDDSRFKDLLKEGERLEKLFGYPLDIEWAKTGNTFHILQARPITALPIPPKETGPTYSMVMAEQFYSGPASPLFFSLFKFLFERYYAGETAREVGLDVLPKEPLMIKHKDHMYVNTYPTEYLLRKAGGLGDFRQQLEVLPEDIRKEFEDSKQKNILGALGLLSKIAFLLLKRPNLRKAKVDREFIRKTIPEILIGLETIKEEAKTKNDMEHQYKMLIELLIQHVRSSKWGLAHCIMLSSLVKWSLEKNHIEDPKTKFLILMSGLLNEKTSKGIKELQILADKFKQDEHVNIILNQELITYERFRKELVKHSQGEKFIESFESILYRYGHRRLARDLIQPSWHDDPKILFNMLRNMILYRDQHDLWTKKENINLEREKVLTEILKDIPIHKRQRFKTNSRYLIRYLSFRELQRFYLDMILSRMRFLILDVGESMVNDGLLEQEHDVFFLEMDEIENYLKGDKTNLKYIAAFRKMSFKESDQKPGLYLRDGVDFDMISQSDIKYSNGTVIKGQSVSSGIFKGKVKVIENIDSGCSILPGTVLVTKSIDPGQTQVFTSAGGLILEVGGVLSHGAILAREFHIPTVAQVNMATNLFYDGQEVLVNGTKGEVVVVKKGK
jgi:phosphohistidine swiveling domain-containing protein